jgi:hypothetical protein
MPFVENVDVTVQTPFTGSSTEVSIPGTQGVAGPPGSGLIDSGDFNATNKGLIPTVSGSFMLGSGTHPWKEIHADKAYLGNVFFRDENTYSARVNAVTNIISLTATGLHRIIDIPAGETFVIDSFEGICTKINNPYIGPSVEFGTTGNTSRFIEESIVKINSNNARHIFDDPQDSLDGPASISVNITKASQAVGHSGFFRANGTKIVFG